MKTPIKKVFSNIFVQGGILFTISNFLGGFLNYIFTSATGRALGPEGYGEIQSMFSYLTLVTFPVGVLSILLVQKIGKSDNREAYIGSLLLWIQTKVKKWWFFLILPLLLTPFVPSITNLSPVTAYTLVILIVMSFIGGIYDAIFQGRHMFWTITIMSLAATVVKLAGGLASLYWWPIVLVPLIGIVMSSLLRLVWSAFFVIKTYPLQTVTPAINKRIIHIFHDGQYWLTLLTTAGILIMSNFDIIYIKKIASAEEAGLYSAWSLFSRLVLYLLGPIMNLSYIFFTSKKHQKFHQATLSLSLLVLTITGICIAVVYEVYPQLLLDLIFGKKYYSLIPYLDWASYFGVAYVFITFFNNYYLAKGSRVALVLPIMTIPYILTTVIWGKDIYTMMTINITYSIIAVIFYLLFYFRSRFADLKA